MKSLLFISVIFAALSVRSAAVSAETLTDLQRELLRNSPEILAAKNRYLAAAKLPIQEGTLPDPTVNFTDFGVGRPFSGVNDSDFAYRGFGVSQELPFPGKLDLKSKIAKKAAAVAEQELRMTSIRLLSQLKETVADYSYLQQSIGIAEKYRELLTQFSEISRVRYKVGQGIQQDVLRADLERSMLEEKVQLLRQDLESKRAEVNALLNRPIDAAISVEATSTAASFNASLQELRRQLESRSPEVLARMVQEEQKTLEVKLAKKEFYPDFVATFQWQRTGSDFPDYYMSMIEARIPLFWWRKQKPAIAQAQIELQATRNEKEAVLKKLHADLKSAHARATTTANLSRLYNEGIIPQTRISLQSAVSAYQVGKIDFLTLLNNASTLLNYESEYLRRIADHQKAIATIEQITGAMVQLEEIELAKELRL